MNNKLVYNEKVFNETRYSATAGKKYMKACNCPKCAMIIDAHNISVEPRDITDGTFVCVIHRCTACSYQYFVGYLWNADQEKYNIACSYPNFIPYEFSNYIKNTSPRFVKLYNQAFKAEMDNNIELAGCGYRNALEILIKDYLINCEKQNRDDVIKLNLNNVISKYLKDIDLSNSADVVRILGNDNTHYEREYDDIDFSVLKDYIDIFIQTVEVKIKTKNPPVSRKGKK